MQLLYLDANCYQRGFDDQSQLRIKMESIACEEILLRVEAGKCNLIWSFMLQDEAIQCPYPERKIEFIRLSTICKIQIGPDERIYEMAKSYIINLDLTPKDAIHIACAVYAEADEFITCDDKLLKKVKKSNIVKINNPVDYIRKEVE